MPDLIDASATSLLRAIRAKDISSAEVVQTYLQRIAGVHPLQVSASGGGTLNAGWQRLAPNPQLMHGGVDG